MSKDLGDDWLCSPPPPPGLATPDASDRPPEASTAWSDEAEAVLRTEVAGQRFKFAAVHWGRAATTVRRPGRTRKGSSVPTVRSSAARAAGRHHSVTGPWRSRVAWSKSRVGSTLRLSRWLAKEGAGPKARHLSPRGEETSTTTY